MTVLSEYKGTFEVTKDFYEVFKECQSIDPSRYFMNCVYFDGEDHTFVAIDGPRMITHKDESIAERFQGQYELAKIGKKYKLIPKEEEGQFPNWQRVVPDLSQYKEICVGSSSEFSISGNLDKDSLLVGQLILKIGQSININYIIKVLKHIVSFRVFRHEDSLNKAVNFHIDDATTYVVMPLSD